MLRLEEPLEVSAEKGTRGEGASRELGREMSHMWPHETVWTLLISLFSF